MVTDYLAAEVEPRPFPWVAAAVLALPAYVAGWHIGKALMRWIGF